MTADDVWIPSYKEVFGTGRETQGPTYSTAFPDNASRIKSKAGSSAAWWWLRSANNNNNFNNVNTDGSNNNNNANNTGGVALGSSLRDKVTNRRNQCRWREGEHDPRTTA